MINAFMMGLKQAVTLKRSLRFTYEGFDRRVSPYLLGQTGNMNVMLHALQTDGATSKGPVKGPEWKFFDVAKIEKFEMDNDSDRFVQAELKKSEGPYVPPKFITQVFALHTKE